MSLSIPLLANSNQGSLLSVCLWWHLHGHGTVSSECSQLCCESSHLCCIHTSNRLRLTFKPKLMSFVLCRRQQLMGPNNRFCKPLGENCLLPVFLANNYVANSSGALKSQCPGNAGGMICNHGKGACKSNLPLGIIARAGNILL